MGLVVAQEDSTLRTGAQLALLPLDLDQVAQVCIERLDGVSPCGGESVEAESPVDTVEEGRPPHALVLVALLPVG